MKYSLMSLMVDSELRHERVNFILGAMLAGAGIREAPASADEAYRLLNELGIPVKNGTASFEDMVCFAKENNFDGLDLMYFQMEAEGRELRAILEKYGVVLSAVNIIMPFSDAVDEDRFQELLHETQHAIDEAAEAGTKQILLVPGGYGLAEGQTREGAFQVMTRGLRESIAYARGKNVAVSTETLETTSVPWASLGEMRRVFDAVPELMYTHDSGNPLVANEDPLMLFREFQDRVVSVHFKDLGYTLEEENSYRCMDGRRTKLVPPGTGAVDFQELIRLLLLRRYDGFIALEGSRPAADKWQAAIRALEYFREMEAKIAQDMETE
ncbi:MAG: sugar phosphate isomerase/epimerase [Oscillospiraceae bacterium]|nr:sugar phosphate isomerase/epimerase [Oscillospiraceae bacterium]